MTLERIERILAVIFAALAVSAVFLFVISRPVPDGAKVPVASVAAVVAETITPDTNPVPEPELATYVEVIDGCGPYFEGSCVNVRSGPGTDYAAVGTLRSGVVLRAGDSEYRDNHTWYRVVFDEYVRYPDRLSDEWWIAGDYVRVFQHAGPQELKQGERASTTKHILVDRSDQMLYAFDGDDLFMETSISTGLELTPTPRGSFTLYRMTPSRYMQGPLPGVSDQFYDLPGVPWDLYFTREGGAIHGAYWHDKFGEQWSHGCVNLPLDKARALYEWADLGMSVFVRD